MAKKEEQVETPVENKGKGKKIIAVVIALLIVIILSMAGLLFWVVKQNSSSQTQTEETTQEAQKKKEEKTKETEKEADKHRTFKKYATTTVNVLGAEGEQDAMTAITFVFQFKNKEMEDKVAPYEPALLDMFITEVSKKKKADLLSAEGKKDLLLMIKAKANARVGCSEDPCVEDVLVDGFIVQ